jgi:glyoxylase-like metal-dependent hydrolase (beta-lactamase superfamily II)
VHLPGHSPDSIAVLDERSGALLSFDCLQAFGIGRYGTGIANVADYLDSIEKASSESMEILVASHEYVPTGSTAMGQEAIGRYLDHCREAVQQLCAFAERSPDLSAEELAEHFRLAYPDLPTVSRFTFGAVKKHLNQIHLPKLHLIKLSKVESWSHCNNQK